MLPQSIFYPVFNKLAPRQGGQFAHFNPRLPAAGRPQIVRDRTETKAAVMAESGLAFD
jgi:hypothetical protein